MTQNILSKICIIILGLTLGYPLQAFDDTVFDQSSSDDLDIQVKKSPPKTQKPGMVIEQNWVDATDLPPVDNLTLETAPPPVSPPLPPVQSTVSTPPTPSIPSQPPPQNSPPPNTPPPTPSLIAKPKPTEEISVPREDWVHEDEDLGVVGSQLDWTTPALPVAMEPHPEAQTSQSPPISKAPLAQRQPALPPPIPPQPVADAASMAELSQYEGPIISVYLQDVPIAEAIKAIAYVAKQKVIVPEEIPGRVTINVDDKPWRWVIDSVLHTKPYVAVLTEGTLVVSLKPNWWLWRIR